MTAPNKRLTKEGPAETVIERQIAAHLPGVSVVPLDIMPALLAKRVGLQLGTTPLHLVPKRIKRSVASIVYGNTAKVHVLFR